MQYLKADTQVKVVVGPVVAVGDGYVPVTTLSLSTADEAEIIKHDAAAVTSISGNTFAAITSADGYYNLTLTAAQLDTEGMLTVLINDDSLCLPVRHDFMVVNANVYDSLFAAATTDYLQVDAIQVGGTTQTARDLGASVLLSPGTGTGQISLSSGAVTAGTVSDKTGYSLTQSFPTNFADLAITVTTGEVTVGTNNDKTGYTASTVSDKTGYSLTATTGLGNQTANITGNLSGSVGSVTGAVGSVAGNVDGNVTGSVGSLGATAKTDVNTEVDNSMVTYGLDHLISTSVADTDIADNSIIAKFADSTAVTADYTNYDWTTDSLRAIRDRGDAAWTTGAGTGLTALASGTAQGGTASTIQLAAGESFADDILNGCTVKVTSGTGAGQARIITDYTGATDTATISPNWITNPSTDSVYEIVEGSANITAVSNVAEDLPTATALATVDSNVDLILVDTAEIGAAGAGLTAVPWNAAWDAQVESEVNDGLTAFWTSPATLVDLVWDETLTAHVTADSSAVHLKDILADTADIQPNYATSAAQTTAQNDLDLLTGTDGATLATSQPNYAASKAGDSMALTAAAVDAIWDETLTAHATADSAAVHLKDILADTNELQTDDIPATLAALNDVSTAEVLAQVNSALDAAISELGVAAPSATPSLRNAVMLLYMAARNKRTTTASADTISNNAGTTICTSTISDDGVTFTKGEYA